ncbi:MAG TPA: DUF5606 domain-containing protein [Bacteroidia bacterium]|nr:DUF5606 domain-containing protein [Bacteroidia bacterium]HRS58664.1 DUF5606 domain-containing protein [Bacteroidia bacterium]HRU69356.1 DUF5606 domain-containing protein [Bacteroidia bacterium]
MTLKDIIAIKGKSDLFRVLSKSPKGIIVETLNETRMKFKVEPNLQVLVLNDITVYPKDSEDIFISQLFLKYYKLHGLNPPVDNNSSGREIVEMFSQLAPNYDEERVYLSDMKKFFKWYKIIAHYLPDLLENLAKEEEKPSEEKKEETQPEVPNTQEAEKSDVEPQKEKTPKPKAAPKKTIKKSEDPS